MGRTILFSYQSTSKKNYKFQGPIHVHVSVQNSLARFRISKILSFRVKEHVPNSLSGLKNVQDLLFQEKECSQLSLSGLKKVQDSHFQPGRRMFGQKFGFQGRTWMFKSLSFREETFVGT
jgi:hypothetical protein